MSQDLPEYLHPLQDPWIAGVFLAGVLAAVIMTMLLTRRRRHRAVDAAVDAALAEADVRRLSETRLLEERLADRDRSLIRAEGRVEQLEAEVTELRSELERRSDELGARRASEAELRTRLEEAGRTFAEKEALLRENGETMKRDFELLATRIFERQGEQHQAKLATVLTPFKDQLDEFRKRVDTVYTTETRDRATLLGEVRNLQQASERINREAENLTRALKGDVKAQGSWGELVLERVLEASGLRRGEEYFPQEARRDGDGNLKRPDVLIRLPGDKDVVVDAKLSLVDYERALAAEDEPARERAADRHVTSLRSHVRRLAAQSYELLEGVRSLDFVLMFVPIEGAFSMAVARDERLFSEAFERRIVIVTPTTLMMTLRIVHNVWRHEKQNRNAREIARRAGALYDKLRSFVADMEALGRQIQTAQTTYESAFVRLTTGRGNLLRRAEELRELGAPVKKPLPRELVDGENAASAENDV